MGTRPSPPADPNPSIDLEESAAMGKNQDAKKETKKKPAKTLKEKRAEKKAKKNES
ncbi:MAG: hypothetical protein R3E12_04500 [Candidatus Eisenbacteria bacterium]|uniref:Uncharacterized protein n=1 Tax=Eiseniibacteriota bacterium TaxID=2212470 RepID=A0A956M0V4_UNCEI|nr:hypothetical protein [Candidatus Eisenbacteria bacterium]